MAEHFEVDAEEDELWDLFWGSTDWFQKFARCLINNLTINCVGTINIWRTRRRSVGGNGPGFRIPLCP